MDLAVLIPKVQESLGGIIKKPALKEKLLSRPPFRFLHDIFSELGKVTGFGKGLLTEDEADSSKLTERDQKAAYINKLSTYCQQILKESVSLSAAKVLTGHDVEKTLAFLLQAARAAELCKENPERAQRVAQRVASGGTASSKPKKPEGKTREKDGEKEERSHQKEKEERTRQEKDKDREKRRRDERSSSASRRESKEREGEKEKEKDREKKEKERVSSGRRREEHAESSRRKEGERTESASRRKEGERAESASRRKEGERAESASRRKEGEHERERSKDKEREKEKERERRKEEHRRSIDSKTHAGGKEKEVEKERERDVERGESARRKKEGLELRTDRSGEESTRSSSRAKPLRPQRTDEPKPKPSAEALQLDLPATAQEEDEEDIPFAPAEQRQLVRPMTARRAPPRVASASQDTHTLAAQGRAAESRALVDTVIVDAGPDQVDEDEELDDLVVEESVLIEDTMAAPTGTAQVLDLEGEQHGALVTDILKEQKRMQELKGRSGSAMRARSDSRGGQNSQEDVEMLRGSIQAICQTVTPIGKCIDYINEDVDAMQKEYVFWLGETARFQEMLEKKRREESEALRPLEEQLQQLTVGINSQKEKLSNVKSQVLRNEISIRKLIHSSVCHR